MPSALLDLPNEILEQIIEETRPREIARFVSCCRLIFTLGHKALESHRLETAFFSVFDLRRCLQDGEAADVYRCLWGLVVDPSRALYLRKLQFSDGYLLGLDKSTFQLIPEILHRASASRNPQYMSIKHSENVRSAFMKGRMMAIALVMLMFAPNLEELSIRLRGPPYGKLTADVVRQIAQVNEIARSNSQDERFNHRSLGNLLKVEILVEPSGNLRTADNLQILDAFLEQPSLKILKGSMILGAKLSRHIERVKVSDLSEINLYNSAIDDDSLEFLMGRIKTLKVFACHNRIIADAVVRQSTNWTFSGIIDVLYRHFNSTITHIDLYSSRSSSLALYEGTYPSVVCIRSFAALKYLRLPALFLVKHHNEGKEVSSLINALPPSIEIVVLLGSDDERFVQPLPKWPLEVRKNAHSYTTSLSLMFHGLSDAKADKLPYLKIIVLEWRPLIANKWNTFLTLSQLYANYFSALSRRPVFYAGQSQIASVPELWSMLRASRHVEFTASPSMSAEQLVEARHLEYLLGPKIIADCGICGITLKYYHGLERHRSTIGEM